MKVGSLVKYVGSAAMYRDRVGVITNLYGHLDERIDSALVHFVGLERKGRAAAGRGQTEGPLHPMALDELKTLTSES
tara:strand:+ start:195 stop:425 length:231 start_codon:yes stop_codon:yes gene_type:complete